MALLHPDSDLSLSIVFYGAHVLGMLRRMRTPTVDDLLEGFLKADKRRTPQNFYATLDMLFATGAISVRSYKVKAATAPARSRPLGVTMDLFGNSGGGDA